MKQMALYSVMRLRLLGSRYEHNCGSYVEGGSIIVAISVATYTAPTFFWNLSLPDSKTDARRPEIVHFSISRYHCLARK